MSSASSKSIIGLVDASGSGGGSIGNSDEWSLIFHLAAWRNPSSAIVKGERRCELPVAKGALSSLMARVKAYEIIEVEIDDRLKGTVTKLLRIIRTGVKDAELEQIARELQASILISASPFGRLVYDREYGWYDGQTLWCGNKIDIRLSCENPDEATAALHAAEQLFNSQSDWDRRVREYALKQLLPLKNDSWLDENEAELGPEDFVSRMTLESIHIDESGAFTFWHDDGDLFWGHAIEISGDILKGLTRADIPG